MCCIRFDSFFTDDADGEGTVVWRRTDLWNHISGLYDALPLLNAPKCLCVPLDDMHVAKYNPHCLHLVAGCSYSFVWGNELVVH